MNLWSTYIEGKNLYKSKCVDKYSETELTYLFEECFGYNKHQLILNRSQLADDKLVKKFFSMIFRRINGEPLQYILGKGHFMGREFRVGEGVLIPRDDTEVLVNKLVSYLKYVKNPKVIDLCSGSGIIAVSLDKCLDNSNIIALELSEMAFKYLCENINNNKCNVVAVKGDVNLKYREFPDNYFDSIVSNPPYIPSGDIQYLSDEVKSEPRMALDGGDDGLRFYKVICSNWGCKIKRGGILAVEIGIGQSHDVKQIFLSNGFTDVEVVKDINSIDRVVVGKKI